MSYERETLEQFLCGFVLDTLCNCMDSRMMETHWKKKKKDTENTSFLYLVGFKLSKLYVANAVLCNICGFSIAQKN